MYRDEEDRHLFDDELPYWLAIGPICWEAYYNENHHYISSTITPGYFNIRGV